MHDHTVKSYDKELETLERRIAEMGGIAEKMVIDAMDALANSDALLAQAVIHTDERLDALQREIEDGAILTIARRQPMAVDLREIVGAIRVAGDLERVGDLAKNIAKRVGHIEGRKRFEPLTLLPMMNELAGDMVHYVLTAYAARDPVAAAEIVQRDAKVDAFYDSVFRNFVSYMVENPATISSVAQLMFVARNIERIGDHATNIAEMVHFAATGTYLPEREDVPPPA